MPAAEPPQDLDAQLEQLLGEFAQGNPPARTREQVRSLARATDVATSIGRYRLARLLGRCGAIDGDLREVMEAHDLALRAMAGHAPARRLAAELYDLQRVLQGQPQKFGTCSQPGSVMDVDPATTDSERAKWDLPSLAELRAAHERASDAARTHDPGDRP